MKPKKETVLMFEYTNLPENLKVTVRQWLGFRNDVILPLRSEFQPFGKETWAKNLTKESLEEYHRDQREENNYKGTLDDFVKGYGLEFDRYLIDQKYDFEGVDQILVKVCW